MLLSGDGGLPVTSVLGAGDRDYSWANWLLKAALSVSSGFNRKTLPRK